MIFARTGKGSEAGMTNRERFNEFLRQEMEEKLAAVASMDAGALVAAPKEFRISLMVHNMLCLYKVNSTGKSIGNAQDVVDWLNQERTEEEERCWVDSVEWNQKRR